MAQAPQRMKRTVLAGVPALGRSDVGQGAGASERREHPKREERRGTAHERGYGHRWRVSSKGFLFKHPLCVAHEAQGLSAFAEVVDHIVRPKGDMSLFWDRSNWQGLCKSCHDSIKAEIEAAVEAGLLSPDHLHLNRPMPQYFPSAY
jgi:5-methylcytosine-specific restriction protein A